MSQRCALITGASRGIGLAIARHLAEQGYRVLGAARREPEIEFPGEFMEADLADEGDIIRLTEMAARIGPVDCLVNNAATATMQGLGSIDMQVLQQAINVNVRSAFMLTQALVPAMRERRWGRVVNISSRAALGKSGRSVYAATKAALVGMARSWSLEVATDGITVNVVAPGPIATEFFNLHNPPDDPRTKAIMDEVPMHRFGRPEEVAAAVSYFLSESAGFVTGQVLYVCGGITVGRAPF